MKKENPRSEFFQKLLVLGFHFPEMRFGQLVCFACSRANETEPGEIDLASDRAVIERIADLLKRSPGNREFSRCIKTLTDARGRLIDRVAELGLRYPEWPSGKLFNRIARLAHLYLYDAEDAELLAAAESEQPGLDWFHMHEREFRNRSTIRERCPDPLYRCPCCNYRTLYERGGFEICPVCYWEDDGQDDADADAVRGGPNGTLSLTEARRNYSTFGICDSRYEGHVRLPRPDEI